MGSMIVLSIGNLDINWGKNTSFFDHSPIFQPADVKDIPYWYVRDTQNIHDDSWELYAHYQEGYASPLWKVADRLQLLGYTMENSRLQYDYGLAAFDFEDLPNQIQFADLLTAFSTVDPSILIDDQNQIVRSLKKDFNQKIIEALPDRIKTLHLNKEFFTEEASEVLDCYTILNLLALNKKALSIPVYWSYIDVVEGGYAFMEHIVRPLDKSNRFLLVTEGSSDAKIIKHAFSILKPHIHDFFDYVDMNEGYPFSGTGNLVNFVKGLISIGIQNNVIVLFDNDAEGVASYNKCIEMNVPPNMQILKLPDLKAFESFRTTGPNGLHEADINGKGAAIECYLDLEEAPLIRWNNFNSVLQVYQAELIGKDEYKKKFLSMKEKVQQYDYTKIEIVLGMILQNCVKMKETVIKKTFESTIEDY